MDEQPPLPKPLPGWIDALDVRVALQPVIRLEDGAVVGYEALLRARDGLGRWLAPRWLIERARSEGAVAAVEARVLARALELRARAFADGLLFVNVDVETLARQPDRYAPFLRGCQNCVLEVTERRTDLEEAMAWFRRWRVPVALDDFGVDGSNLDRLLRLQPDYVKLDRYFVAGVDRDPRRQRVVRGVVALVRSIGSILVAEGVETPGEHDFLRGCDVPLAQGFFFGTPVLDESLPARGLRALTGTTNGRKTAAGPGRGRTG
ncbi:MAG: EAL domain-containing protein [Clostridia bacterium]|nr:EAL domain-containing protein [Clostridia bacterium]